LENQYWTMKHQLHQELAAVRVRHSILNFSS